MAAPDAAAIECPHCGGDALAELSDGTVICLECRTEWDPNNPPVRVPAPVVPPLVTADSILGPPAEVVTGKLLPGDDETPWRDATNGSLLDDRGGQDWLDDAVGTRLVLEGGQVVTVVEIVDEDWVRVQMNDDRQEIVNFADVVRSVPAVPDVVQAVDDIPDDAMRILTAVGGLLHAVAQITRACNVSRTIVANILATYADADMPDDADLLPIVLGDAIAALQMLAEVFGLPAGIVRDFASVEPTVADAAESEMTE